MAKQMSIGLRLRGVREAKGLSQSDVAGGSGLKKEYISRIENEHIVPTFNTLEALAAGLKVDVIDIVKFGHNSHNSRPTEDEKRWAKLYRQLSKRTTSDRKKVLKAVEKLISLRG